MHCLQWQNFQDRLIHLVLIICICWGESSRDDDLLKISFVFYAAWIICRHLQ